MGELFSIFKKQREMISKKKRNRGEREIGLGRLRERERAL
jgi:hypothetical protein